MFANMPSLEAKLQKCGSRLEHLQCCSWSSDGRHLLLGAGKKLVLCTWQDLGDINTYSIRVLDSFDTHGNISCISSIGESSFVVSAEVPLEKLCGFKTDDDLFEIPQLSNGCELAKEEDQITELIIRKTSSKEKHSDLLNLKYQNNEVSTSVQSQLMLINCRENKPVKLCCKVIIGLVSPDLLSVDPFLRLVVVGSNTSNELQIFSFLGDNNNLKCINTVHLGVDNRPKGLCKLPGSSGRFLVMQGKPKMEEFGNALPVTSIFDEYKTNLELFESKKFLPSEIAANSVNGHGTRNNGDSKAEREIKSLQLPGGKILTPCQGNVKPLVEELSAPSVVPQIKATNVEDVINLLMEMKADVQTQLKNLHTRLQSFEAYIKTPSHCVCKWKIPTLDQAEFVSIEFTHGITSENQKETFLLENGKLKLRIIKETFSVNIVKLVIGNNSCIISEDPNGYIPLQFISGSTVKLTGW